MKITSARYTEAAVDRFPSYNNRSANLKLKESEWKIRPTKVDAGNLKHELLNRLQSTMAVNVLTNPHIIQLYTLSATDQISIPN
jgi:hypothetical protein